MSDYTSLGTTIILSIMALIHLGLSIFLSVVWVRRELIPADQKIVMFWLFLSIVTAGVCGTGALHLARLAGFLEALR
jgi:hypothetical protein